MWSKIAKYLVKAAIWAIGNLGTIEAVVDAIKKEKDSK